MYRSFYFYIMKESFYFSHDNNSCEDEKIIKLRMEYWWEWYWIFWWIIEKISQNDWFLENNSKCLAFALHLDSFFLDWFLNFCFDIKLLILENWKITSKRLLEHIEKRKEIKNKRRKAGRKWWLNKGKKAIAKQDESKCLTKRKQDESKTKQIKENKIKIKENKIKIKEIKKEKEIPPSLEELIKINFTEDFLLEIYNKYEIPKEDFKEECKFFVKKWNEGVNDWKKPRRQKEKSFDVKLRFHTWMRNYVKWNPKKQKNIIKEF